MGGFGQWRVFWHGMGLGLGLACRLVPPMAVRADSTEACSDRSDLLPHRENCIKALNASALQVEVLSARSARSARSAGTRSSRKLASGPDEISIRNKTRVQMFSTGFETCLVGWNSRHR